MTRQSQARIQQESNHILPSPMSTHYGGWKTMQRSRTAEKRASVWPSDNLPQFVLNVTCLEAVVTADKTTQ
jgi:hypothetical protein